MSMSETSLGFIHHFLPGAATTPDAPVLLLLHGTGGTENDLLNLGQSLYPGAPLLSPRGKELENGMPRFFRRLAEGIFDEPNLIQRTHELAYFIGAAAAHYRFNAGKVVAVGYSNGANIAASLLLLRPGLLNGAVLLRGMTPLIPEHAPDLTGTSVFLASGRHDSLVPAQSVKTLSSLLHDAGADLTLEWADAGHQLTGPELQRATGWLASRF
jgi:phospholipase/carboxylesterase